MCEGLSLFTNHDLAAVFDIYAWARAGVVDATARQIVDSTAAVLADNDGRDCRRCAEDTEGEIGRLVVVRIPCIFQILASTDILQGEALAVGVIDVPNGSVLHILAVTLGQSEDETAPACLQRLRIQIAGLAPDAVFLAVGGDEPQQVGTRHLALLQLEEISGVGIVEGGGVVLIA